MGNVLCSGSSVVITAQEMSVHAEKITAECSNDRSYITTSVCMIMCKAINVEKEQMLLLFVEKH